MVVPEAFRIAGAALTGRLREEPVSAVRRASRDVFRRTNLSDEP
jgi:hypothetical protein